MVDNDKMKRKPRENGEQNENFSRIVEINSAKPGEKKNESNKISTTTLDSLSTDEDDN